MEENRVMTEEVNVEETQAEQIETPAKVYTEEEFKQRLGEALDKKVARREAKIRKEYERKYGTLENVLKAGTGKDNVEEMTDTFKKFYEAKGIQFQQEPTYSDRDVEILARAEAKDIIDAGFEDVVEELDRLSDIGVQKMTAKEKAIFRELADYHKKTEQGRELAKIGVTEDVYSSGEFKDFAKKFSASTPITEIYEIYSKMQPKKEIRTMGSMKTNTPPDTGVKEFYTVEEARAFTKKDYDKNPALFEAVQRSMTKWK
jgi:hypothetical protein